LRLLEWLELLARIAMSTPACEPSTVYPRSVNFAEVASIDLSRIAYEV
jgi:hypothetical protein